MTVNERMECERTSGGAVFPRGGGCCGAVEIQGVEDKRDSNHKPPDERPACRIVSNHVTNHPHPIFRMNELDIYKTYVYVHMSICPAPKWNESYMYLYRGHCVSCPRSLKLSLQKENDESLSSLGICAQVVTQSTNYHSPSSLWIAPDRSFYDRSKETASIKQ